MGKRDRESAERDVDDVVVNDFDTARRWECDEDLLVGEHDDVYVLAHPLKAGYLHFVITPKVAPPETLQSEDADIVSTLANVAKSLVAEYSSPASCVKLLTERQGEFGPDPRMGAQRWSGKAEVANFKHVYEGKTVPFAVGFEAFDPAVNALQLHVISKDFIYVRDAAEWNLLSTEWGLLSPDALALMLGEGLDVTFPSADEMGDKCKEADIKCWHTGLICTATSSARKLALSKFLARTTSFREDEVPDKSPAAPVPAQEKAEEQSTEVPSGDLPSVTPEKPKAKVKSDKIESVVSSFKKWAEYYFQMKSLGLDSEAGVREAEQQMQALSKLPCVQTAGRAQLQVVQRNARDKFFNGRAPDSEPPTKRRAQWSGHDLDISSGKVDIVLHDEDRAPF